MQGKVIEDYREDARGHSCLLHGHGVDRRDIHAVCAPKEDFLAIITAYPPRRQRMGTRLTDKETTMNCVHCHGQMKRSNAPFHIDRNGYHLLFDSVPALGLRPMR